MVLYPPANQIAFSLFNINIYWYGIIMAFAILVGIIVSCFLFKNNNSKDEYDKFSDVIPIVIISSIIGARFFYVIGDWNYYSKHLSEIIMVNHGGISIYGAIIFGVITFYICSKVSNFSMLKYCDTVATVMPLCQSIGRWGNFINQEAYGLPYNGFLKMYIDKIHRYPALSDVSYYHPAFLYESVFDFALFFILLFLFFNNKKIKSGTIFYLYLILYALIRLFIENIRVDSILNISGIHIATILSALVIIFSLTGLKMLYNK